ncbi:DUF2489 domain-containing protein [Neisseria animalis]|uniref:DUF2489 domain-containing protein n=1 Tax=Neisseria animalis TaxID=492 RepID=A0A5P3MUG3_NEIAN|nr:DUF2489 domain-containing protein [Neisseria animalis]QEY24299.1 DUF2489 domain-containing protein [Neisseria animalis]ROW32298.1 DUF2489 domain-containing protein [Neisseria animalis]VEE06730.1 Protein of uncharacterised function (DUF2489) [Neisseria animalis]
MKILITAAILLMVAMAVYAAYLWIKVYRRQQGIKRAWEARRAKIAESVNLIAMAMEQGQCNLSEGVLRLKPLAEVLAIDFAAYPAMGELYEMVAEMPVLDARKQLKRNERMKLDLIRESGEARLEQQILAEAGQLRAAVARWLPES